MDERPNPYAAPSTASEAPRPERTERDGMHPLQIAFVFVLPLVGLVVLFATLIGASMLWNSLF